MTKSDVTAHDAGTINCTATINGSDYISESFTLQLSGELLWLGHCVFWFIMYMLALFTPFVALHV